MNQNPLTEIVIRSTKRFSFNYEAVNKNLRQGKLHYLPLNRFQNRLNLIIFIILLLKQTEIQFQGKRGEKRFKNYITTL